LTAASSVPVKPAHVPDPALNGGPSRRIVLRRSAALHLTTAFFIVVAVAAVYTTLAAHFGIGHAACASLVIFAILSPAAFRHGRNQPGTLKIGPEGLSVWNRAGILRAQGNIVGCSQWSDSLLMLWLKDDSGRSHRLLLAADMLDRDVFLELAVLARRAANV
jgi:hypothetical protein